MPNAGARALRPDRGRSGARCMDATANNSESDAGSSQKNRKTEEKNRKTTLLTAHCSLRRNWNATDCGLGSLNHGRRDKIEHPHGHPAGKP